MDDGGIADLRAVRVPEVSLDRAVRIVAGACEGDIRVFHCRIRIYGIDRGGRFDIGRLYHQLFSVNLAPGAFVILYLERNGMGTYGQVALMDYFGITYFYAV